MKISRPIALVLGKTGTSQISENGKYADGKYILSFIGFSPMNDPKASIYVEIENPKGTIQYGGVVAAPIAKSCLENILPILNVERSESPIKREYRWGLDQKYYKVDNYVGIEKNKIKKNQYLNYLIIGEGDKIISQSPVEGENLMEGGTVILYT